MRRKNKTLDEVFAIHGTNREEVGQLMRRLFIPHAQPGDDKLIMKIVKDCSRYGCEKEYNQFHEETKKDFIRAPFMWV